MSHKKRKINFTAPTKSSPENNTSHKAESQNIHQQKIEYPNKTQQANNIERKNFNKNKVENSNQNTQKVNLKNNFGNQPESFTKLKWPSLKKKDNNSKNTSINKEAKKNHSRKIGNIQPTITKFVTDNEKNTLQNIKEKLSKRPKVKNVAGSELILIHRDLLPKKFINLMKAKEALKRGDAITIKDALEEFDITSAFYYKHNQSVIPFYEATKEKIFTLIFEVEQEENALTKIVTMISRHFGEILTLNKGFPVNRMSSIFVSFDTSNLDVAFDVLLSKLESLNGVRSMKILGRINSTVLKRPNKFNKNKNTNFSENSNFNQNKNFDNSRNFSASNKFNEHK